MLIFWTALLCSAGFRIQDLNSRCSSPPAGCLATQCFVLPCARSTPCCELGRHASRLAPPLQSLADRICELMPMPCCFQCRRYATQLGRSRFGVLRDAADFFVLFNGGQRNGQRRYFTYRWVDGVARNIGGRAGGGVRCMPCNGTLRCPPGMHFTACPLLCLRRLPTPPPVPAAHCRSLLPDSLRCSETGARFMADMMSKHAMHAGGAEEVLFAGELPGLNGDTSGLVGKRRGQM